MMLLIQGPIRYLSFILFSLLFYDAYAIKLSPISHPDDVLGNHGASGYTKRASNYTGTERLDLRDLETFHWAAYGAHNLIYANLTLYFPEDDRYVISMDRFIGMLESVDCSDHMMLEFKDNTTFAYAKSVWNWVNTEANNTFIMVANYNGCSDDAERQPFVVYDITYDDRNFKAYLTVDQQTWEEVTHAYSLSLGHIPVLETTNRSLTGRDDPDFSMNLESAFDQNLFHSSVHDVDLSIDAVVRTTGHLNVDFNVDVGWKSWHLTVDSASMTVSPQDLAASIDLVLSESGTLSEEYSWQKTIISMPIEGVEIKGVGKIGAFLDIDVGFTMEEWKGEARASFGARVEIPNSASFLVDAVDTSNNKFSGWTPSFVSNPLAINAKVEGGAQVFAEPNIKLSAEAIGLDKGFEVGLNLKMPYIEVDFSAELDSTGVCGTEQTLGVDIGANVGVDLFVQAATTGNEANPFWKQDLYTNKWPLYSKCFAFGPENAHSGSLAAPQPPKTRKSKTSKAIDTTVREIPSGTATLKPTETITKTNLATPKTASAGSTEAPATKTTSTQDDDHSSQATSYVVTLSQESKAVSATSRPESKSSTDDESSTASHPKPTSTKAISAVSSTRPSHSESNSAEDGDTATSSSLPQISFSGNSTTAQATTTHATDTPKETTLTSFPRMSTSSLFGNWTMATNTITVAKTADYRPGAT